MATIYFNAFSCGENLKLVVDGQPWDAEASMMLSEDLRYLLGRGFNEGVEPKGFNHFVGFDSDPRVQRKHCLLACSDGVWKLRPLEGSVAVDGSTVLKGDKKEINQRSRIKIGNTKITIVPLNCVSKSGKEEGVTEKVKATPEKNTNLVANLPAVKKLRTPSKSILKKSVISKDVDSKRKGLCSAPTPGLGTKDKESIHDKTVKISDTPTCLYSPVSDRDQEFAPNSPTIEGSSSTIASKSGAIEGRDSSHWIGSKSRAIEGGDLSFPVGSKSRSMEGRDSSFPVGSTSSGIEGARKRKIEETATKDVAIKKRIIEKNSEENELFGKPALSLVSPQPIKILYQSTPCDFPPLPPALLSVLSRENKAWLLTNPDLTSLPSVETLAAAFRSSDVVDEGVGEMISWDSYSESIVDFSLRNLRDRIDSKGASSRLPGATRLLHFQRMGPLIETSPEVATFAAKCCDISTEEWRRLAVGLTLCKVGVTGDDERKRKIGVQRFGFLRLTSVVENQDGRHACAEIRITFRKWSRGEPSFFELKSDACVPAEEELRRLASLAALRRRRSLTWLPDVSPTQSRDVADRLKDAGDTLTLFAASSGDETARRRRLSKLAEMLWGRLDIHDGDPVRNSKIFVTSNNVVRLESELTEYPEILPASHFPMFTWNIDPPDVNHNRIQPSSITMFQLSHDCESLYKWTSSNINGVVLVVFDAHLVAEVDLLEPLARLRVQHLILIGDFYKSANNTTNSYKWTLFERVLRKQYHLKDGFLSNKICLFFKEDRIIIN